MRYKGGMKSASRLIVLVVAGLAATTVPAQERQAKDVDDLRQAAREAFAKWEASDLSDRSLLETAVRAILRAGAPAIADLGARATAVAAEKPADRRKVEALDAAVTHVAMGYLKRESEAEMVYEGQVTGEHRRDEDVLVNPCKKKHLTNIRSAGADEKADFPPPVRMSIEECLEFIVDDELLEVTPKNLRMRKRMLKEADRRRESRNAKKLAQDQA